MYHLFAGSDYYPGGGMVDYCGAFLTIDAAKSHFAGIREQWAQIAQIGNDGVLRMILEWEKRLDPGGMAALYRWREPA